MTLIADYPPELLSCICAHIYSAGLPSLAPTLDPLVLGQHGVPSSLPSSYPPATWSEIVSRRTLATLCLVNHTWYEAAKPWLWQKVEIRLPRTWIAFVEQVSGDEEENEINIEHAALVMGQSIRDAALATSALLELPSDKEAASLQLQESIMATLTGPDLSIPLELLSPLASRDPSPRRIRAKSKSPVRWKLLRSIADALQNVMDHNEHGGMYVPTLHDPHPARHVRHLDFNHFRTIGMRRSVDEGMNSRFVTGDRIEAVLREMPNLTAFGATEYMDGALTLPVLNELFLRGSPSRGRGRPSRGRGLTIIDPISIEEENRERRRECKDLEAIDLTGCVSAVFVSALSEFVTIHLLASTDSDSSGSEDDGRQGARGIRRHEADNGGLIFPALQRLGLRGVKSILPRILTPFVLAFPSLTHLDLSGTRATPELLSELGMSTTVRLQSLALARCIRLTGESIRSFLIDSPVTSVLRELNLYGDMTFQSPLSEDDLRDIFTLAPCFLSQELVYIDLSSSPLTRSLLDACGPQPKLRSLGLSYIPDLGLNDITDFILKKAANIEVLTLIATSPELDCGTRVSAGHVVQRGSSRSVSIALHTQFIRPLCTPPFSFSLTASSQGKPPPTRLRVIELSMPMLGGLGAGAGSWRIIRSKGGRGWYVDTASGWVSCEGVSASVLRRDLEKEHPLRIELERLADANGNVSSGTGWHARKMEVLHGYGMLGREDGLYGAVSFAYQG